MSRTNRLVNEDYSEGTLLGTEFTFLRFQAELIRDLASGEERCLPQFVEFVKEIGTVLRYACVVASGWLQSIYKAENGTALFILHADSILQGTETAEVIERTIEVLCHTNGVVSIKKFGQRKEISLGELQERYFFDEVVTPVTRLHVVGE